MYHLSRNNIITGPYTKEALIVHGILSSDFIRKEGETEWHAPEKFEEFKNNIAASKPKFKITANKEVIELKTDASKSGESAEVPANSPFKRVPSAVPKKKISTEKDITAEKETGKNNAKPPAVAIEQTPAAIPSPQNEKVEYRKAVKSPVVKAQNKEVSSNAIKEIFAPLLIIGGIGIAIWFGYKKFGNSTENEQPAINAVANDSVSKAEAVVNASHEKTEEKPAPEKHVADSARYYARRDSIRKVQRDIRDSIAWVAKVKAKNDSLDRLKRNAAAVAAKENIPESTKTIKQSEPKIATTPKVNTPATVPEKASDNAKKTAAPKKGKSISDYVAVSVNKVPDKEVKGIKLNIKNVSDQSLNIAIIDVSYKDASGKIIRGETLQAENIGAGKTASVKVPNEKNAADISYKVSLISGDNVYLMGK